MGAVHRRSGHPFHMYEAIYDQPGAFARVVEHTAAPAEQAAARLAGCERLFLVGIGTSHHAAQVGEHLLRAYGGGARARAVHAFDFALYGPALSPRDGVIGISHRGAKRYSAQSLARAREAGCATVLVTGEAPGAAGGTALPQDPGIPHAERSADVTLRTVPQEPSSAHTVSYTAAVAALASLAQRLGRHRTGTALLPPALLRDEVPAALRAALEAEPAAAALAREHLPRRRIWLVGGGPSAVTAQEAALKIKETSYLGAEGMPVEAMLHGPFQCTEADDLFVLVAPAGPGQARTVEFADAVREIGAAYAVVSDGTPAALRAGAAGWWTVPAVPEPLSALSCLVPLQLFAYHLALARGTNPDAFRLDDPRFARAYARVRL
jgi:glucosamine--fructose-6-phosphate aminotransferase (isomerizing)